MQARINPSKVSGTVIAPASKSAMQRACAAALVKGGATNLRNAGISADDKAAQQIIQALGATISEAGGLLTVRSNGVDARSKNIDCGESGLSVRMFTPIAALSDHLITINGSGSLLKRPLDFFAEVLPQLGVQCNSNNGLLPLQVKGPLLPKSIEIDGSLSSQFLTGLLFAYAAADASDVSIFVKELNSKPYIDLTLQVMADFGLKSPLNKNYQEFYFSQQSVTQFSNETINYTVEGDWSGGAFLLVAGAIAGNISVQGLDVFSCQADKAVIDALKAAGADVRLRDSEILATKTQLQAFQFDATDCPDLFPPLVTLAAFCQGTTVIKGVHRLAHKESNRALTLQQEFTKMGVAVTFDGDNMLVIGGAHIKACTVDSHHDHRIAMACAVAALNADGEVIIDGAEAVNKSYPQFWEHLQQLNATVSLMNN